MLLKASEVVFIIIAFSPLSMAVFQQYMPALQPGQQRSSFERDDLIERYFRLGLQHWEILAFLMLQHGIQLSLRQLSLRQLSSALAVVQAYIAGKQPSTAAKRL